MGSPSLTAIVESLEASRETAEKRLQQLDELTRGMIIQDAELRKEVSALSAARNEAEPPAFVRNQKSGVVHHDLCV